MVDKILKDRYRVEEQVGEGGMALVYRAHDTLLNRPVAVKVMRRELVADPSFVERFRREAEAAAGLSHPHIATVFDFGEQDGDYFLVMEYLPSKNLKRLIEERGAMPLKVALEIAIQLADALKYAHSNGIIHRDVKPQNVLFTEDGKVKLTDFGIARAVSSQTPLTGTGQLVGSVHYMSPEQARGLGASERSDVYALGIILFEMLSGRLPFDADTPVAVALKHVQEQPPAIREIDPSLPSAIEYIVSKALKKEATARYQTAQELMQDLVKVKEGRQVTPSMPPAAEKAATAILERRRIQQATAVGRPVVAPPPARPAPPPQPLVSPMTWVILVLTVLIVGGAAGYVFLSRQGQTTAAPKTVLVPDLSSLDRESAVGELRRLGLLARVSQEESEESPPDTVLRQSPRANSQVDEGSEVEIWVSTRPGAIVVPNLVGMPLDKVQSILNGLNLTIGNVSYQPSLEMQQGYVLKQDPTAGSLAQPKGTVNLVLAEKETGIPLAPTPTRPEGDEQPGTKEPATPSVDIVPITTSESGGGSSKDAEVRIKIPQSATGDRSLRIVLKDEEGERDVEKTNLSPGDSYHEIFHAQGKGTIRVLIDDKEVKSKTF
jgi:serine/threonine-protein kinase